MNAIKGVLTHSPSRPGVIEGASCVSRDILSFALSGVVVLSGAASHLHLARCAAGFPTVLACWRAYLCSRGLSLVHRPDCPMWKRPQGGGVLYTAPCAQFINLRMCRTLRAEPCARAEPGDRELQNSLKVFQVYKCFHYVDDFLVCIPFSGNIHDVSIGILEMFKAAHCGLQFTYKLPVNDCLQFLDLSLKKCSEHTCWSYRTRSEKGLLPFDSAHTRLIKRGSRFRVFQTRSKNLAPPYHGKP